MLTFYRSQLFGDKDVPGEELHEILREIDTNMNGQVELDEYLQVCESSHARISRIVLLLSEFLCCITPVSLIFRVLRYLTV